MFNIKQNVFLMERGEISLYREEVELKNETGLHARPASLFVQKAGQYKSNVKVIKDGKYYNAKSIMGILTIGAIMGDKITIEALGEDEKDVVKALVELVNNKFDE